MALWTPANLSGSKLHRWIKGSSFTTSGGSITGGTTSDSSASTITKVSTNWPTYNASGLNGHPTITSGGSNLMSIPVDIDYDCSVFVVVKPNALSGYHNVYELSGDKCPMLWIDSSNRYSMNGAGSVIEPSSPVADGSTWRVVSTINRSSGTRSEERIDGTSKGTNGESVGSLNVGTGLTLKLLGRSSGNGLQGDLAELVITYGALTSDDEARIEGYLAWKYGLQSQLDSGHTYKSAAPTDGSADSTGSASGTGTATGTGASLAKMTGSSAGAGAASGTGAATFRGTGSVADPAAYTLTAANATGGIPGAGSLPFYAGGYNQDGSSGTDLWLTSWIWSPAQDVPPGALVVAIAAWEGGASTIELDPDAWDENGFAWSTPVVYTDGTNYLAVAYAYNVDALATGAANVHVRWGTARANRGVWVGVYNRDNPSLEPYVDAVSTNVASATSVAMPSALDPGGPGAVITAVREASYSPLSASSGTTVRTPDPNTGFLLVADQVVAAPTSITHTVTSAAANALLLVALAFRDKVSASATVSNAQPADYALSASDAAARLTSTAAPASGALTSSAAAARLGSAAAAASLTLAAQPAAARLTSTAAPAALTLQATTATARLGATARPAALALTALDATGGLNAVAQQIVSIAEPAFYEFSVPASATARLASAAASSSAALSLAASTARIGITAQPAAATILAFDAAARIGRVSLAEPAAFALSPTAATVRLALRSAANAATYVLGAWPATGVRASPYPDPADVRAGVAYGPGGMLVGTARLGASNLVMARRR